MRVNLGDEAAHQRQDGSGALFTCHWSGSSLGACDLFAKPRREFRGPIEVVVVRPSPVDPADEPERPNGVNPRQENEPITSKPFDSSCFRTGLW